MAFWAGGPGAAQVRVDSPITCVQDVDAVTAWLTGQGLRDVVVQSWTLLHGPDPTPPAAALTEPISGEGR